MRKWNSKMPDISEAGRNSKIKRLTNVNTIYDERREVKQRRRKHVKLNYTTGERTGVRRVYSDLLTQGKRRRNNAIRS